MLNHTLAKSVADPSGSSHVRRYFGRLCAAVVGLSIVAIPASANIQPLTLANASFEIQNPFDQTVGCGSLTPCYNYSIIDWNQFGSSGTFDPSLAAPPIAPPAFEGKNVAWLNSGSYGGS
jgi:hypothetical protein